jgi:hypothetical protein
MTHRKSIGRIVAAHLMGVLLIATGAQAGGPAARTQLHHGQQASLGLGTSKCMVVGEVVKCVPAAVASS